MAAGTDPIFPNVLNNDTLRLTISDGTDLTDLFTPGADGSKVTAISVHSDDDTDIALSLYYHDGTNARKIGTVTVTDDGAQALLNATDMPWLPDDLALHVAAGHKLQVAAAAAMTTAKVCDIVAFSIDY